MGLPATVARVIGVLYRPRQVLATITDAAEARKIWRVCLLVLSLALIAHAVAVRPAQAAMRAHQYESLGAHADSAEIDPSDVDMNEALGTLRTAVFAIGVAGSVAGLALVIIVGAGLLTLCVRACGRRVAYVHMLALHGLSLVPVYAGKLLQGGFTLATGSYAEYAGLSALLMHPGQVVGLPGTPNLLLLAAAAKVDAFVLWQLALLVAGLMAVGGLTRSRALITAGAYWVGTWVLMLVPLVMTASLASQAL